MSEDAERYDSLYLSVLQNEGSLPAFFDSIFSFLMRRTDFYHRLTDAQRDRGFREGVAFNMVVQSFRKHEAAFESLASAKSPSPKPAAKAETKPKAKPPKQQQQQQQPTSSATVVNEATGEIAYSADADCYNGAARDGYAWSQSIGELDVRVSVDQRVAKGNDVRVDVQRRRLRVRCRQPQGDAFDTVLDRELCWDVRSEEAVWSLLPSDSVVLVSLEKVQERWWDACFTDEEKINTRRIDCSRPITDLDDEAQAKIGQMMYDQRQKELGLPTSEEAKTHELLRKAWDAEGSPFKGTPFDPSVISGGTPFDPSATSGGTPFDPSATSGDASSPPPP